MPAHEHPMPGQVLMIVNSLDGDYDNTVVERRIITADPAAAHVATSYVDDEGETNRMHKPVLDIDFPVQAVPSSTPGHFHLYLDKKLTWEQYDRLLGVMAEIGLLEPGYVSASRDRKHTSVRLPWVRKATTPTAGEG
jgi:hypothetical protein